MSRISDGSHSQLPADSQGRRHGRSCAGSGQACPRPPYAGVGTSGRPRMNVSHLIAAYGYWALFALVAAESLGIPVPGETALIIAGIYAGHTHRLSPWLIFAVAAVAAIIGDNIGYWIGGKGGTRSPGGMGTRCGSMSGS